jgi:hypothetical protein
MTGWKMKGGVIWNQSGYFSIWEGKHECYLMEVERGLWRVYVSMVGDYMLLHSSYRENDSENEREIKNESEYVDVMSLGEILVRCDDGAGGLEGIYGWGMRIKGVVGGLYELRRLGGVKLLIKKI